MKKIFVIFLFGLTGCATTIPMKSEIIEKKLDNGKVVGGTTRYAVGGKGQKRFEEEANILMAEVCPVKFSILSEKIEDGEGLINGSRYAVRYLLKEFKCEGK